MVFTKHSACHVQNRPRAVRPSTQAMGAVLLDRDGVINALVYHEEQGVIDSPLTASQFRILPRVPEAIRALNRLGLPVAIVSNQPSVAKGKLERALLDTFDRKLDRALKRVGAHVDGVYYCLHHPEAKVKDLRVRCRCRKPKIGLLQQASHDLGVALDRCYMVGDGIPDMVAGQRAGCKTIFVGRWKCEICQFTQQKVQPTWIAKDLWNASQLIKQECARPSAR